MKPWEIDYLSCYILPRSPPFTEQRRYYIGKVRGTEGQKEVKLSISEYNIAMEYFFLRSAVEKLENVS